MANTLIRIEKVCKDYGKLQVVKDLSMNIQEGEFLTMLGPSGCGKTTTLRMLAGFEKPSNGSIYIQEKEISGVEPFHRQINTVFQNYALFPHMTIFENIAFGLSIKKVPKDEIAARVSEMLDMVQMGGYENRRPDQISGGQKQRVAIARALINRPQVLLLDEPLGALDLKLRKQMQTELKALQKKLGITFVYVTHDQEEALTMSDRIAIMSKGVLEQLDVPRNIYEHPASKFVADFIGESNIFYGSVEQAEKNKGRVILECGSISVTGDDLRLQEIVDVSVRPENTCLSTEPVPGFDVPGQIKEYIYIGNVTKVVVELANGKLAKADQSPKQPMLPTGSLVYLYWDQKDAVLLRSPGDEVYQRVDNPVF